MEVFESREKRKAFFRLVAVIDLLEGREKFAPLEEFYESWAFCYPRVGEIVITSGDFFTFKDFQSFDILFGEDSKLKSIVDAFLGSLMGLKSLCLHEWFGGYKKEVGADGICFVGKVLRNNNFIFREEIYWSNFLMMKLQSGQKVIKFFFKVGFTK